MKHRFLKYWEFGLRVLKKLRTDLQMFVSDVLESKNRILKQYIIGMVTIILSSILIATYNLLVYLPNSYDLNPLNPVNRSPVSLFGLKVSYLELVRGFGLLNDSIKVQGHILAYQVVISSAIAKIYANAERAHPTKTFQQSYLAFLLILLTMILIAGGAGGAVFLEGKISWLILFSTVLGIFLTFEQFQ